MYHRQAGMFAIPLLNNEQLAKLHGTAFGIPRIDDSVYKCELILGKRFTNASSEAPDWVLSLEGEGGAHCYAVRDIGSIGEQSRRTTGRLGSTGLRAMLSEGRHSWYTGACAPYIGKRYMTRPLPV